MEGIRHPRLEGGVHCLGGTASFSKVCDSQKGPPPKEQPVSKASLTLYVVFHALSLALRPTLGCKGILRSPGVDLPSPNVTLFHLPHPLSYTLGSKQEACLMESTPP